MNTERMRALADELVIEMAETIGAWVECLGRRGEHPRLDHAVTLGAPGVANEGDA